MDNQLYETIKEAKKNDSAIITTVEAFHKEPVLLYDWLRQAANNGVDVTFAAIVTTDQSPPYTSKSKESLLNESR